MTQKELGQETGIDYRKISAFENGLSNMNIQDFLDLYDALGVDIIYIFQDKSKNNKKILDVSLNYNERLGRLTNDQQENVIKAIDHILKASGV